MSDNGKGSEPRPKFITDEEYAANYDRVFGKRKAPEDSQRAKVIRAHGNMYDWVTHMWSPFVGCKHDCSYCYVKASNKRRGFDGAFTTPVFKSDFPDLWKGRTIFVGNTCDMFSDPAMADKVAMVLEHCAKFDNKYVFQTKNPAMVAEFMDNDMMPENCIVGTTIETDDQVLLDSVSKAPPVQSRAWAMQGLSCEKFITIEPVMKFTVDGMMKLMDIARPDFVNIGADSKDNGLPEPSKDDILGLVYELGLVGVPVRKKINLERIMNNVGGAGQRR